MYQYILSSVVLFWGTAADIRWRKIPDKIITIYFLLAVLGHLPGKESSWEELILGMIPGGVCMVLSWLSREAIGYGDSMLILGCGISLGIGFCVEMLSWAFLGAAVLGMLLLIVHRTGREKEIPFVPFLLGGFCFAILW